jgi:hypothetical protein
VLTLYCCTILRKEVTQTWKAASPSLNLLVSKSL